MPQTLVFSDPAAGGVDVLGDSTAKGAGELELDNSALLPAGTGLVVSNYTLTLNGSESFLEPTNGEGVAAERSV